MLEHFSIEPSWDACLQEEYTKSYFQKLAAFVCSERKQYDVYPPKGLVFHALQKTPYDKVKVVLVGQDPYHGPRQAHGLCFSVPPGIPPPPSLQNIFKELNNDLNIPIPSHGCLEKWAEEGVLLLNVTLTVRAGKPLSHHNQGWEQFTDAILEKVSLRSDPVVFLLWGRNAISKCQHVPALMQSKRHLILTAAHPSPFSAYSGFFGCQHFSKTNNALISWGKTPIDWKI